ncbi:MAG TPA: ABC transporter ATP-binding protein [Candidatus Limnocylindrales bacterium]|nr:ABC transporter ATP-binding protein [Candidatus Limnocylindrales bacterium]
MTTTPAVRVSLEAARLTAGYGARTVIHDITLRVAAGEIVSVVGPNGAGKSTLIRALTGIIAPSSGDVHVNGRAIAKLSRAEIAQQIAVVPQGLETLFPFSVREIVALGRTARLDALGRGRSDDAAAVARALALLDLEKLGDRRIDLISGGERQRVVLAMAIAQETPVLLLDEPTVHLDPAHQLATIALVRRLACERDLAVLAVVHDLSLAALADRVVVLAQGRIVRSGRPDEVIDDALVEEVFGAGWRVGRDGDRTYVRPA